MGAIAKRIFDVIVSLMLLICAAPLMLLTALMVAFFLGRPIFFCQQRPGLHGKLFTLCKFRTMKDLRGPDGELLPDPERQTSVGRFLRATSLDELPELFNVLLGHMSLVGPRPLLPEFLDRYTPEQARRHDVKPGLTGLAQISGRNVIPFSRRLELDVYYVDNWSLWFDFKIFLATIPKLLRITAVGLDKHMDEIDDLGLHANSEKGRQRTTEEEGITSDGKFF